MNKATAPRDHDYIDFPGTEGNEAGPLVCRFCGLSAESNEVRPCISSAATVTVYSRPGCVQCTATYRALDARGIAYDVVKVSESEDAREYVRALGFLALPVVVDHNGQTWNEFRPDLIDAIEHRDLCQGYTGGEFVTVCSCGAESTGQTPDDADADHLAHVDRA